MVALHEAQFRGEDPELGSTRVRNRSQRDAQVFVTYGAVWLKNLRRFDWTLVREENMLSDHLLGVVVPTLCNDDQRYGGKLSSWEEDDTIGLVFIVMVFWSTIFLFQLKTGDGLL